MANLAFLAVSSDPEIQEALKRERDQRLSQLLLIIDRKYTLSSTKRIMKEMQKEFDTKRIFEELAEYKKSILILIFQLM